MTIETVVIVLVILVVIIFLVAAVVYWLNCDDEIEDYTSDGDDLEEHVVDSDDEVDDGHGAIPSKANYTYDVISPSEWMFKHDETDANDDVTYTTPNTVSIEPIPMMQVFLQLDTRKSKRNQSAPLLVPLYLDHRTRRYFFFNTDPAYDVVKVLLTSVLYRRVHETTWQVVDDVFPNKLKAGDVIKSIELYPKAVYVVCKLE
ncbi:Hypothetical protein MVR_LOCUS175 [uncultured virus]|nr:Hypothetical protein MVR_LOCUS175 [uncultured virus]